MTLPIDDLLAAWYGHAYLVVAAILIGFIVTVAKQGWLGDWIAAHLPPKARPYLAMAMGFLLAFAGGLEHHRTLIQALLDAINGILAGGFAVAGHQVIIEGWRKGKEIIPKAPPANDNDKPPADKAA